jgi:hypothetical protein
MMCLRKHSGKLCANGWIGKLIGWGASDHANNWQAVAAGGLGMAALSLLGESSDAEMWLEEAIAQMKMLLNHGFDSDGAYFESPMYHKYTMNYIPGRAAALAL